MLLLHPATPALSHVCGVVGAAQAVCSSLPVSWKAWIWGTLPVPLVALRMCIVGASGHRDRGRGQMRTWGPEKRAVFLKETLRAAD